jgi:hypothetical protein
MSRPKPNVLLEITDKKTYNIDQVLESDAIWAVFYKGKPINLKMLNYASPIQSPKYKKISFSNSGHAFNLAEKLNKKFNSKDFAVFKLTSGECFLEEPKN